jgi:hypothetical protein
MRVRAAIVTLAAGALLCLVPAARADDAEEQGRDWLCAGLDKPALTVCLGDHNLPGPIRR